MIYPDAFEKLWKMKAERRPNNNKQTAFRQYKARLKQNYTHEQIETGTLRWCKCMEAMGLIGTPYVMLYSTFLGPDAHFMEDWEIPRQKETVEEKAARLNIQPKVGELTHEYHKRILEYRE